MIVRSRAPLRISFAGGGTDVSPFVEAEGGVVLSATIDRYAYATLRTRSDPGISIHSIDFDTTIHLAPHEPILLEGSLDLVKAALARFSQRTPEGFDLTLKSSAPPGSGLGSSSTVMVALVALLSRFYSLDMAEYDIARLALEMERDDLRIVGGMQDHYAATFGGFNFIEFQTDGVLVNPLRIASSTLHELQHNLLLVFTGITRESSQIIEDQSNRVSAEDESVVHSLREQKRLAIAMKRALLTDELDTFGSLLDDAWQQKKRMSPKISNPTIDKAYDIAKRNGAIGGKVTGAGGGGHMLLYCDFAKKHIVAQALESAGMETSDVAFSQGGGDDVDEAVTIDYVTHFKMKLMGSADVKASAAGDDQLMSICSTVATVTGQAIADGHCLYFFGNGGSSMDAGHLAAELVGRFYLERRPLPAMALSDHTAAVTAIGNDYSYDEVFARQVEAYGRPGDVVFGMSTSGNSSNVVIALERAKKIGLTTVAMTGAAGGRSAAVADYCIAVPTNDTPRVQECHMTIGHTICELIESSLFS